MQFTQMTMSIVTQEVAIMRMHQQTIRPYVLVVLLMSVIFWTGEGNATTPDQAAIQATMKRVADYWLDHQIEETPDAQWHNSVFFAGLMALGSVLEEPEKTLYTNRALQWAQTLNWELHTGNPKRLADNHMAGQTYIDLYLLGPPTDCYKIDAIKESIDAMLDDPTHEDWFWIDAIFMAAPVFSRIGYLNSDPIFSGCGYLNSDPVYYRKMYNLYRTTKVEMGLFYPGDSLWVRDENYHRLTRNGRKIYWSRGNGWVIGSLPRILNFLADTTVTRPMDPEMDSINVSASSYQSSNVPDNTLDGDLASRWSAKGNGESIVFDLGAKTTISNIGIAFFKGDQRHASFSVEASDDGEQWTTVIAEGLSSAVSLDVELFEFDQSNGGSSNVDIEARFVKIIGYGNTQNAWNSFTEVQINAPLADEFIQLLANMAESLKNRQRSDGFWNVNLDDPLQYCGPETSGTALFTYAMAWGLNHGYLDEETYLPVVARAWNGLVNKAVHTDGKLGFVQGVGESPASSKVVSCETTSNFGVGAFLMAGSEVFNLPRLEDTRATASDYQHGNPPENTLDDDPATRWSAKGLGQWIQYDLDGVKHLDRIDIAFYRGDKRRASFDVAVSENGTDWTPVIDDGLSSGATLELQPFAFSRVVETRHVRIIGHGNQENAWNSITEVSIPAWTHAERALASDYQCPNASHNAFDGNLATRWSSKGDGEWIQYDLGRIETVHQVAIAFYRGDQRRAFFDVGLSTNREDWTAAIIGGQSSGDSLDPEPFDFIPTEARYVRVTGYGNSENSWNSITHIDIYTAP
jgi:rhamnogalacturonyl hydrolase YesR